MVKKEHRTLRYLEKIQLIIDCSHHKVADDYGVYFLHFRDKGRLKIARNIIELTKGFRVLHSEKDICGNDIKYSHKNEIGIDEYLLYVLYDLRQ